MTPSVLQKYFKDFNLVGNSLKPEEIGIISTSSEFLGAYTTPHYYVRSQPSEFRLPTKMTEKSDCKDLNVDVRMIPNTKFCQSFLTTPSTPVKQLLTNVSSEKCKSSPKNKIVQSDMVGVEYIDPLLSGEQLSNVSISISMSTNCAITLSDQSSSVSTNLESDDISLKLDHSRHSSGDTFIKEPPMKLAKVSE